MQTIIIEKDSDNILHMIFTNPDSPVNLMNWQFADDLSAAVDKILADDFAGVIMRSDKSTFFAGGDLQMLAQTTEQTADRIYQMSMQMKQAMRQLELSRKPVVACINGAALGGGFELALACDHRICVDDSSIQLGLPEVTLGLLPGAGGVTRMVRLLGLQQAMPYLTQGKLLRPAPAKAVGLIDELVSEPEQLLERAKLWIAAHPQAIQPYDEKGYKLPGGSVNSAKMMQMLAMAPVMIRNATKGTLPAPEAVISAMVEGAQVDFESAQKIESRYFAELAKGQVSTNLINTLWTSQNAIKAGVNRPQGDKTRFNKIGVIGAGMMGAGIAYACANKGITVVLNDVDISRAEAGKDYSRKLLQKQLERGHKSEQQVEQILSLILPSTQAADMADCQLVVEAVFEDRQVKATVTKQIEPHLNDSAVFASNTSTLPISGLAKAAARANQFIGMHFFSPVDKMPLVEIICGEQTDQQTLAKVWDLTRQLGKMPIVVSDSRGFYTSRVFQTFVKEGIAMLTETSAASVENGAWCCGFPVGPLAVSDEVSLGLFEKIQNQAIADGVELTPHPGDDVVSSMIKLERLGKLAGQGFYDYQGQKSLWPELDSRFNPAKSQLELTEIKDRLLFIMALESVRCYEQGVLRSVAEANVGALLGIGYPQWTGGTLQFINQYGLAEFVARADELAQAYGERFKPTERLIEMAANAEEFK